MLMGSMSVCTDRVSWRFQFEQTTMAIGVQHRQVGLFSVL